MSIIMQYLCCCCFQTQGQSASGNAPEELKKKKQSSGRYKRLRTKFKQTDFELVSDQDRKGKKVKAYCCPICALYYTRILACNECVNFTCFACYEAYYLKNKQARTIMKCAFCNSQKSLFVDYQLDPHSYFDTSNIGFLNAQERRQIDSEMELSKKKAVQDAQLEKISQQA